MILQGLRKNQATIRLQLPGALASPGRRDRSRLPGNRRGAALLEMVLGLPVIILIFVIAIDLSRFLVVSMALHNAANEGVTVGATSALTATTTAVWKNGIESAIRDNMERNSWFDNGDLSIDIPTPSAGNGLIDNLGFRSCRVSLFYASNFLLPWPTLTSDYEMQVVLECDTIR